LHLCGCILCPDHCCVCQLGFWSFCGDLLKYQWVIIKVDVAWSNNDDSNSIPRSYKTSASISKCTSAPTSTTTSSRTTASQAFTTGYDDNDDDGYQLSSHPKNVHWTATNKKGEENNVSSSAERQMHIRRVHQMCHAIFLYLCGKTIRCGLVAFLVTTKLLQSVVQKHNRILFVGDSVLRQQYLFLLCMIDPMFEHIQMKSKKINSTTRVIIDVLMVAA